MGYTEAWDIRHSTAGFESHWQYIENQEKHHHNTDFKDELLRLLQINNVAYNEKYLWDWFC